MPTQFQHFNDLHHSPDLFILPNAWDVKSAVTLHETGFPAIATSSAAISSSLGYPDGESMPFQDYLFIIRRIISSLRVPLSVDMEMGYGSSDDQIFDNMVTLTDLGVAGINIEDSSVTGSDRALKDADRFATMIAFVRERLRIANRQLFINIRCDTYLLDIAGKEQETRKRIKLYENAGADGIFLPCISREDNISEAVQATALPVNVMAFPGLPGFDELNRLGVKRCSMGSFLFEKVYERIGRLSREIITMKSAASILSIFIVFISGI